MDFLNLKDLLGKKLDPAQFDAIMRQIELGSRQDEQRDRDMEEAIKALTRKVEELAGTVADYNTQLRALSARVDSLYKMAASEEMPRRAESTQGKPADAVTHRQAEKPQAVRRFYATLDPDGRLREVGDNYGNRAPFVAEVKGDSGEAAFNAECLEYCLPRAESAILPFFDYSIETPTPTAVVPNGTARITRCGDVWEMSQKIKITLK